MYEYGDSICFSITLSAVQILFPLNFFMLCDGVRAKLKCISVGGY